jgi:hypothetical protein
MCQPELSRPTCPSYPVPTMLPQLFCPGSPAIVVPLRFSCPCCPVPVVMPWLSATAVRSQLSCPCCHFLAILFSLSFKGWTDPADLSGLPVQIDLSQLSCPSCPISVVLSQLSCPVMFWLSCHLFPVMVVLPLLLSIGGQVALKKVTVLLYFRYF